MYNVTYKLVRFKQKLKIKVCLQNYFNLRIIKYDHCYWAKPRTWLI
jgi:hypothetical protein